MTSGSFVGTDAFAAHALSSAQALAAVLDHTLLKPEATHAQVLQLCAEAAEYRFACAMVNACWVPLAVQALAGTGVPVGVVIGFPLGATSTANKLDEMEGVVAAGAHDIDMVLNVGFLKSGMEAEVASEIRQLALLAHGGGRILKVILETALLSEDEKRRASEIAVGAGADFIKTSTGFSTGGATVEDIALMRAVAGETLRGQGLRGHPVPCRHGGHAAGGGESHWCECFRAHCGGVAGAAQW